MTRTSSAPKIRVGFEKLNNEVWRARMRLEALAGKLPLPVGASLEGARGGSKWQMKETRREEFAATLGSGEIVVCETG